MSTTIFTANPGINLMQEEMECCIAEIQAIETELSAQFEVLGEQIDAGFKQIGELTIHGIKWLDRSVVLLTAKMLLLVRLLWFLQEQQSSVL